MEPATGREFARLPSSGGPYCFSPDGSQLVTYAGEEGNLHVWDLRLIRRQLKEMDLDWDLPAFPAPDKSQLAQAPLRVNVLPGETLAPSNELRAQAHVERAFAYVRARKYSNALKDFNDATKLDPKQPLWTEVVTAYSQVIKQYPGDAEAHHQRAHAQERLGQWHKAVADHTLAIEFAPERGELHRCRGRAHLGAGQKDRALEDYLKVSAGKPTEADDIARYLLTSTSRSMRDPNIAMVMAKQATRDAPEQALYWNTLGLAHYRLKEWDTALEALAKAEKLAPGKHVSVNGFVLAMCHHQQGDAAKAKHAYDRAVRGQPEESQTLSETQRTRLNTLRAEAEALLKTPAPRP
jgi:tetratricopeptide (TPR) repeat protein